jgi:hypothetical protein
MQSSLRYFLYVLLLLKCCVDTEVHAYGLNFCSQTRPMASTIKAFTSSSVLRARDRILSLSSLSSSLQEHEDRRLGPDDWLNKIFEDEIYQPHPIYYDTNLADDVKYEDAVHIITSPSDKLKQPLIDFDCVAQVDRIEKDFFEGEVKVDLRRSRLFEEKEVGKHVLWKSCKLKSYQESKVAAPLTVHGLQAERTQCILKAYHS